jgi:hypothetical protein
MNLVHASGFDFLLRTQISGCLCVLIPGNPLPCLRIFEVLGCMTLRVVVVTEIAERVIADHGNSFVNSLSITAPQLLFQSVIAL